ncbi:hypothetical protein [Rhodococcus daqingensis]|uniref:DUF222 domain-containing protein n=1 Tax=Rhodococcus daqingensis TaxID=2479363 RepID=A0ABW2S404_9NOCA
MSARAAAEGRRPDPNKVPRIVSSPLPQLPEDHPLVALVYLAASVRGLGAEHRRILAQPEMSMFAPTLARLHRRAHAIHAQGGAAAPQQLQTLVDIALIDLAELPTRQELRTLRATPVRTTTVA